eukprot:scaffold3854_cov251-Pinguiococcus_pyrenoidosus.AAC.1
MEVPLPQSNDLDLKVARKVQELPEDALFARYIGRRRHLLAHHRRTPVRCSHLSGRGNLA